MITAISNTGFTGIRNLKQAMFVSFGQRQYPKYLNKALEGDTFTKTNEEINQEQLRRETPNDFITWSKRTKFVPNGIKAALHPDNLIGEGFDHSAYKIPGNDDYVLRIKNSYYELTQDIDYSNYKIVDTRDMKLDCNIGQQVALLVDEKTPLDPRVMPHPRIEILKKQKGYANGNPSPRALYIEGTGQLRRAGLVPYEANSRKEHYAKCMKALAEMPDSTYDQLIDDLLIAGEACYKFDTENSNNFLIDEENQRINLIDMSPTSKPHKDRFGNTLYALINAEFLDHYISSDSGYVPKDPEEKNNTVINVLTIMDKYTQAMRRKLQKYNLNSFQFHMLLNRAIGSFWLKTWDSQEKIQKLRDMGVLYEDPNQY